MKGDVAPVSDDLGTDLHQLLPQCGQWPVFDILGQRERPLLAMNGSSEGYAGQRAKRTSLTSHHQVLVMIIAQRLPCRPRAMDVSSPSGAAPRPNTSRL